MVIVKGNYLIEKKANKPEWLVFQVFNYDNIAKEIYECYEGVGIFYTREDAIANVEKWNSIDKLMWGVGKW